MPSKQEHKILLDQLRLKFPHLRDEIAEARDAIFHAHSIIEKHRKNPKKAREALKHMARTRVLPVEVARHFLDLILEPLETMNMTGVSSGLNITPIRAIGKGGGSRDDKTGLNITIAEILREMGFALRDSFKLGHKIKVFPVRIGMPGTPEEGTVFGPPKNDTRYPIDEIKVIQEKDGSYYVGMFSSKAKGDARNRAITWRGVSSPNFLPGGEAITHGELIDRAQRKLDSSSQENTAIVPYQKGINIPPGTRVIPSEFSAPGGRRTPRGLLTTSPIPPKKAKLIVKHVPLQGGTTSLGEGTHEYSIGDPIGCDAIQNPGYEFVHWMLDDKVIEDKPNVYFTMSGNHVLKAVFRENKIFGTSQYGEYSLDINWSPPGAGKTTPDRGHHTYRVGEVVTVVATADAARNYYFAYWILDGRPVRRPGSGRRQSLHGNIQLTMDQNHTIMAVFRYVGTPGTPGPNVLVQLPGGGGA